jgi:hypothetical protein
MTTHIKLYGGKGEQFREIKDELAHQFGYEPTNPEVVGLMMAGYPSEDSNG